MHITNLNLACNGNFTSFPKMKYFKIYVKLNEILRFPKVFIGNHNLHLLFRNPDVAFRACSDNLFFQQFVISFPEVELHKSQQASDFFLSVRTCMTVANNFQKMKTSAFSRVIN